MIDVYFAAIGARWSRFARFVAGAGLAVAMLAAPPAARGAEGPAAQAADDGDISLFGAYLAGRQASGDRDRSNAARFFSEALELDPDNRMLLERTIVYQLSSSDFEGAIEVAPRVLASSPNNLAANILLGLKAMRDGNATKARLHFSTNDSGPIAQLASDMLVMWSHQAAGEPEAARAIIDDLEEASAFGAFKDYHAALLADMQGRDEDAEAAYRIAYDTTPGLRTVDSFGRFLERKGRADEAIELYRAFLEDAPGHPIIAADLERAEAGGEATPLVADAFDGAAETLYAMGSALTRDGGGDLALIYLNLATYARPDFSIAHYLIADIHERQNRYEEAIAAYSAVSADSPLKREAETQAALNLNSLDRTDEARARLDSLIAKDPTDRVALISAGTMMRSRQRFEDALPYYDRAIALIEEPSANDWQLFYFRGICYERTGQWDRAEADLQEALDLEADQPLVLNYLGYSWIDLGIHLDEGLKMVEKAVEQRPDDGYIVDSLGWAYFRLGDYERSVEELERAVELRPDDPVINDHLGDAYWRVGRQLEARFQWDHAIAMKPEEEDLEKIRAKLENGLEALAPDPVMVAAANASSGADPTPAPAPANDAGEVVATRGEATIPSPDVHVVEPGDTLWDLARRYLGSAKLYEMIFDANRDKLDRADRIFPGAELLIPPKP